MAWYRQCFDNTSHLDTVKVMIISGCASYVQLIRLAPMTSAENLSQSRASTARTLHRTIEQRRNSNSSQFEMRLRTFTASVVPARAVGTCRTDGYHTRCRAAVLLRTHARQRSGIPYGQERHRGPGAESKRRHYPRLDACRCCNPLV